MNDDFDGEREFYGPTEVKSGAVAARLSDATSRAIGAHYGIGATAVGANHRRLSARPELLQVVDTLADQLLKRKAK